MQPRCYICGRYQPQNTSLCLRHLEEYVIRMLTPGPEFNRLYPAVIVGAADDTAMAIAKKMIRDELETRQKT